MTILNLVFVGFIVVRYINHLFCEKQNTGEKPIYFSNRKETTLPLLPKYYTVLELDYQKPISIDIITRAHQRLVVIAEDDIKRGYQPNQSLDELHAAKAYLIDFCNYTGRWN